MCSHPNSHRLPIHGETIELTNLISASHLNGQRGRIVTYIRDVHRYKIELLLDADAGTDGDGDGDGSKSSKKKQKKRISVKPENVKLVFKYGNHSDESKKANSSFFCNDWELVHVLIPCHIDTERRREQFRQCSRSIMHQTKRCRVMVSISGIAEFRQGAIGMLRLAATFPEGVGRRHQWFVVEEKPTGTDTITTTTTTTTKKSQFQHYKTLLSISMNVNPDAWLMFLDNDDLYHPVRVEFFQNVIRKLRRDSLSRDVQIFYSGGKLLLDDEKIKSKFGDDSVLTCEQFESFDEALNGLVFVAATMEENSEMDVLEYFDFCVQTRILQRYIELTPDELFSNRFCDVRFLAILANPETRCVYHPELEWLLMHYRVRQHDRHQRLFVEGDLERYNNSMTAVDVSEDDRILDEETGLGAVKIAICRKDVEEAIMQVVHRGDEAVTYHRNRVVTMLDEKQGHQIGTRLWDQTMSKFSGYFSSELAEKNRQWWKELNIPLPNAELDADREGVY